MFELMIIASWALFQSQEPFESDPPISCGLCETWNQEQEPFQVFGNTYYVGTQGLSALLVATDDGLILLDGALPQSAELIDRNIRKLGFHTEDVRFIVNSHAHFDHAGGIAALQRVSGATVVASPAGAAGLRQGAATKDDPQAAYGESDHFPPVGDVQLVDDGEVLRVGAQEIKVHFTPGHTPGGTTWTWQACDGPRCLDFVYADSLTAVSAPGGFRFTGDDKHTSIVPTFRASIAKVSELPCDIMISTHPEFSNLLERLDRREQGAGDEAFVNPEACRAYAAGATERLDRRIAEERETTP